MAKKKQDKNKEEETICEFFGIKLTTKNPHVARALTTDVRVILDRDVKIFNNSNDQEKEDEVEEARADAADLLSENIEPSKQTN